MTTIKNQKRFDKRRSEEQILADRFESLFPGFEDKYVLSQPGGMLCLHCVKLILESYDYCAANRKSFSVGPLTKFSQRENSSLDIGYRDLKDHIRLSNTGRLIFELN
jgi:hypothetical protein